MLRNTTFMTLDTTEIPVRKMRIRRVYALGWEKLAKPLITWGEQKVSHLNPETPLKQGVTLTFRNQDIPHFLDISGIIRNWQNWQNRRV